MESHLALALQSIQSVPDLFVSITLRNVVDILIVSVFIYLALIFIKQTKSFFILNSIVALVVINFTAEILDLGLTRSILQPLITGIVVIGAIVFQAEIRRFFRWVTTGRGFTPVSAPATNESIKTIVDAVWEMGEKQIGALIVFPGESPVDDVVEGGFVIDGKISRPLLLSIFDSNSPGHDGAVLIERNRIRKFGLHLPLAEDFKSFTKVGTRHRAGAGVTEHTDAIAIIVSEERGTVSIAENGSLRSVADKESLLEILKVFSEEVTEAGPLEHSFWHYVIFKNIGVKLTSLGIAIVLWFLVI